MDIPKRRVAAPSPILGAEFRLPANRILSVEVAADEAVQWIWATLPDGGRYVSGYTVIPNPDPQEEL